MKPQNLAELLHYPECWDTAAYPTLEDAAFEILLDFECSNPHQVHK